MMDLEQLEALVALERSGTFTAAARRLAISQSSLSRRIARLEDDLGQRLVERASKRVRFTAVGREALVFARATLDAYARLRTLLDDRQTVAGTVRVLASTTPGEYVVPQLVSALRALYPGINVEVRESDTSEAIRAVTAGDADVGFIGSPVGDPRLVTVAVADDEIVLGVHPSHRFARRRRVDVGELVGERLIFRELGSGTYRTVTHALARRGLSLPADEPAMVLGSTQAVSAAVAAGLGIGFVSSRALQAHAADRLVAVRLDGVPLERQLLAIHLRDAALSPATAAFVTFVRDQSPEAGTTQRHETSRQGPSTASSAM